MNKTCPHIRTETAVFESGKQFTFLRSIDPNREYDCEVCRKLEAFDDLLAACEQGRKIIKSWEDLPGGEFFVKGGLADRIFGPAIAKATKPD